MYSGSDQPPVEPVLGGRPIYTVSGCNGWHSCLHVAHASVRVDQLVARYVRLCYNYRRAWNNPADLLDIHPLLNRFDPISICNANLSVCHWRW